MLKFLQSIAASLAQLVTIQQQRLAAEIKHMTIDDTLLQQILDVANVCLSSESTDVAALAAKDALIASLQAQLAPNPALLASAQTFLANALAANPPVVATPTPVVAAPGPTA